MTTSTQKIPTGYKQTEIGVIPADWDVRSLESLVKITSGESPSRFKLSNDGIPYFKVEQLNIGTKYQKETPYYIRNHHVVPKKSLIFPKRGASILLNKIKILSDDSFMDTNLMTLSVSEELDNEYLYYALLNFGLWKVADTTSIPQINNKHINPLLISFPPTKTEQTTIAIALSDADTLISKLELLIEKKKKIKQGVMHELLTGKRRLSGFSDKWEVKKVGDIGKPYGGLSGKVKGDFGAGNSSYIPFMNIMSNPIIDPTYLDVVNIRPGENQNEAQKGDLFFNGSSETPEEIGMCSVLLTEISNLYLNSFCFGFRLNQELKTDGLFFSYYFRSSVGRQLIFSLAQGAIRYNLSKTNFLKLEIPYPKPEEQSAIATVFYEMDAEIEKLESQLTKYQNLKQGMMQVLLTGKIRLLSK